MDAKWYYLAPMQDVTDNPHTKLSIRTSTKAKLAAVKDAKDWSFATTIDKAADALIEKEGIKISDRHPAPPSSAGDTRSGQNATSNAA